MGARTRAVATVLGAVLAAAAIALSAAALAGCGDAIVIIGDAPGVLRIVAGIPDSAGAGLGPTATRSPLSRPHGLAADAAGVLYIADRQNVRILSVTTAGVIEPVIEHADRREEPRLRAPAGLALDGAGGLVIADPGAHRVWRLEPATGELEPLAGTGIPGTAADTVADARETEVSAPTGVAIGPDGAIYFSEFTTHRIRRIEPDGSMVRIAGDGIGAFAGENSPAFQARLRRPAGLTIAGNTLYIADSGNERVRAIDLDELTIRTVAGSGTGGFEGDGGPATEAAMRVPTAVTASEGDQTLFIADRDNHRVRLVNLRSGRITTFAGTGAQAFNGDLLAAASTALHAPEGLALSAAGFLFIADTGHNIVRRTSVRLFSGAR